MDRIAEFRSHLYRDKLLYMKLVWIKYKINHMKALKVVRSCLDWGFIEQAAMAKDEFRKSFETKHLDIFMIYDSLYYVYKKWLGFH